MNAWLTTEWLGDLTLRGTLLVGLALLAGLLLRRLSAGRRYGLWLAAMTGLLLLPALLGWGPAWRVLPNRAVETTLPVWETPAAAEAELIEPSPPAALISEMVSDSPLPMPATLAPMPTPPAQPIAEITPRFDWLALLAWLPALWLAGVVLGLGRLSLTHWRLRRLRRGESEHKQDARIPLLREVAQQLGLRRLPRIVTGEADAVPMVWGVWQPCLLLPVGLENWPSEKQRAVLLHELAHLARRDPMALWLGQLARVLHWFNPLAWLILRRLRADQERACDDAVLRHGVRASDYAQVLLDLSRQRRPSSSLALGALAMARPGPVEQRLQAILDHKRSRAGASRGWRLLWVALGLMVALPLAVVHAVENAKARGRIVDRNGVVLAETRADGVRVYPQRELAAHVVGYTQQTKESIQGITGMEKAQESELEAGRDVRITLDYELQKRARDSLQSVMAEQNLDRGAVVVLDPSTGEALAMVSEPSFDPNDFTPQIGYEKWDEIQNDWRLPMQDRTISATVPGSAYKMVSGLVAVQAGIADTIYECKGSITYGSKTMHCWIGQKGGAHGKLGLTDAMMRSCSCYWYQSGNEAGINAFQRTGSLLGLGKRYGLSDQEKPGVLPGPEWLKQNKPKENWSEGFTANTAIGQGFVLISPLQMAVVAATIANRGKVPKPRLLRTDEPPPEGIDLTAHGADSNGIEVVRHGLWRVVNDEEGTASSAKVEGIEMAGKTGTAQVWRLLDGKKVRDNCCWFVGFAPYENPKIAFAVMVQGGQSGGGTAAPVAKRMVEAWLKNQTSSEEIKETDTGKTTSQTEAPAETITETWRLLGISESETGAVEVRLQRRHDEEVVTLKEGESYEGIRVAEVQISSVSILSKVVLEHAGERIALGYDPETMKLIQGEARKEGYWTVKTHDGRDYVPLREVASFYRLGTFDVQEGAFVMEAPQLRFTGKSGDAEMFVNGVKLIAWSPVVEMDSELWVSRMTLVSLIEPALRPKLGEWQQRNVTVVIDAGSGPSDANGETDFADRFSWSLAEALKKKLESEGIPVVMTRGQADYADEAKRVGIINDTQDSVVVGLMMAKNGPSEKLRLLALSPGASVQANEADAMRKQGVGLALLMHQALMKAIGKSDMGVSNAGWTILEGCARPGMMALFGKPESDEEKATAFTEAFQSRLAEGLARGVLAFRELNKQPTEEESKSTGKTTSQVPWPKKQLSETWTLAGISASGGEYTIKLYNRKTAEYVKLKQGERHEDFRLEEVHFSKDRFESHVVLERDGVRSKIGFDQGNSSSVRAPQPPLQPLGVRDPRQVDEKGPAPDTERRWRLLQTEGGLGELPAGARELKSQLVGSWPRQVQVSFIAPQQEVLNWLEFSPGRVRDSQTLYPLVSDSLLSAASRSTSRRTMTLNGITYLVTDGALRLFEIDSVQGSQEAWKRIGENMRAGKTGRLGSVQCGNGVSVSLSKRHDAEIEVTMTRARGQIPIIAE